MPMVTVSIDLEELIHAFDNAMHEVKYYLDRESGHILLSTPDYQEPEILDKSMGLNNEAPMANPSMG